LKVSGAPTITSDPNYHIRMIEDKLAIKRAELRSLWSFWRSKAAPGRLPSRRDFLIEEFLPWGRNLSIMQRDRDTGRFRVTLASTAMIDLNGCNPTGLTPEEFVPPRLLEFGLNGLRLAGETRCAVLDTYIIRQAGRVLECDRLTMPCATDGETIDGMILGHYFDRGFLGQMSDVTVFERVDQFSRNSDSIL
jgi:hypothetical protein